MCINIKGRVVNMKKNKSIVMLCLFDTVNKLSWTSYLIAALMVIIPTSIVLFTGNAFNPFYRKIFINTAIAFVIIGKISVIVKKTIEDGTIPWANIGTIIGLLIVLISDLIR